MVGSLVVLGGVLFRLERRGYLRGALLTAVVCLLLAQVGFYAYLHTGATATWGYLSGLAIIGVLLFLFFIGFNAMEASQPSLVSKFVVPEHRALKSTFCIRLRSRRFFFHVHSINRHL